MQEPPDGRSSARARAVAIILIVAAAGLVTGLDLTHQPADPPSDLSGSLGVMDEGLWSHNAVNDALFGRARLDDLNPMYVTSAPDRLIRLSYAIFGVGILQTRLPSILLGAATVLMVGLILARKDPVAGVVGAWVLATSYLFLGYSRLGLLETPAVAFVTAAMVCFVLAVERPSRLLGAAAGAFLAIGVTSKPQAVAAAGGLLIGVGAYVVLRARGAVTAFLVGIGSFAVVCGMWAAYVAVHLDRSVRAEWHQHALGIGVGPGAWFSHARAYISSNDGFARNAAPLLIAAAIGLVLQVVAVIARRPFADAAQPAGALWAIGMLGAIAAIGYGPSRYPILALPALALVAGGGVVAARALLPAGWARALPVVALVALVAAGYPGIARWSRWAAHPSWSARDFAAVLARETRPGDVIAGGFASVPGTEAHRHVVVPFPLTGLDSTCVIERNHVRFVVVSRNPLDQDFYQKTYPGLLRNTNLVARPSLIRIPLAMYRVPPSLPPAKGCG